MSDTAQDQRIVSALVDAYQDDHIPLRQRLRVLAGRCCAVCNGEGARLRGMGEAGDWIRCKACGGSGVRL